MKKSFKLAALFVAAAISVAVVSCNKDKETEEPVASQSQNSEAKELLNRIYAFQELRDDINSGAKSGESMTLEELRDNIDLTFNFEHSQHATPFDYATLDTFYVRMPQTDANGNVSAADAIATYNAFETSLENLLANVEDDANLAKNFSIKFPETGAKSGDDIEVVFTRGEGGEDPSAASDPFEEGDDYIWGLMLGHCDPSQNTGRITDAANELTRIFQSSDEGFNLVSNVEYAWYKPYNDNDICLPDYIYYHDRTLSCDHGWLFCYSGDDEPCIEHDGMNCHYRSINRIVVSPDGDLHWGPKTGYPYYECLIDDITIYDGKRPVKMHALCVTYLNSVMINE